MIVFLSSSKTNSFCSIVVAVYSFSKFWLILIILPSIYSPTRYSFLVLDSEGLGVYNFTVERDYKLGSVKQNLSFDPVFDSWKLGESTLVVDGIRVWK